MRIAIVGGGFVGVTTAVAFAERGHTILLTEADDARLATLRAGRVPFFEPGLAEAFAGASSSGALSVVRSVADAGRLDAAFLCVGTPPRQDGSADVRQLLVAAEQLATSVAAEWRTAVIVKSTVPPGTAREVVLPALRKRGVPGVDFGLGVNPEFLREGSALVDARKPDRIVVGAFDVIAQARLSELYSGWPCPTLEVSPETAEMIKYASNAYLALKIGFANEIANLCERTGVHVDEVMRGVGMDARIGPQFLRAGLGFGGSCFPKDLRALHSLGQAKASATPILDAVLAANETQPLRAVALVGDVLGGLAGRRVALLGLAFKPATSDVRETRAWPIYRALIEAGAEVVCHDPVAGVEFQRMIGSEVRLAGSPAEALDGADACIIQTEWPEYARLTPADFARMRRKVVVDGRRVLDAQKLAGAGITYRAVGVGTPPEEIA